MLELKKSFHIDLIFSLVCLILIFVTRNYYKNFYINTKNYIYLRKMQFLIFNILISCFVVYFFNFDNLIMLYLLLSSFYAINKDINIFILLIHFLIIHIIFYYENKKHIINFLYNGKINFTQIIKIETSIFIPLFVCFMMTNNNLPTFFITTNQYLILSTIIILFLFLHKNLSISVLKDINF